MKKDAIIISLAWPETWVRETEASYNVLSRAFGISRDGYYKVGHAALVLIDLKSGHASYFDCGRYDCPPNLARVRSCQSDPGLELFSQVFDIDDIFQTTKLLWEIAGNENTNGDGPMHWGIHPVNYKTCLKGIRKEINRGFFPYGPFDTKGSNCSRFVLKALIAGGAENKFKAAFKYGPCPLPIMLTRFSPTVAIKAPAISLLA